MTRIYESDIRLDITGANLPDLFTYTFYTVSQETCITKTQADAYTEDGKTYIALDWGMLQLLGQGALSYILTKHIPDSEFPDRYYDQTINRLTNYYIVTDVEPIEPTESSSTLSTVIRLIEGYTEDMELLVSGETLDRMVADQELEDAISGLTGRVEILEGQDLSAYATKVELESGVTDAKGYADNKDAIVLATAKLYSDTNVTDMATKTWVEGQGYLKQHQDLSGYLTRSDYNVDQRHMASKDWTQEYLTDEGYTTKDYVDSAIGSRSTAVELTQAEYDALLDKDPNTLYIITDAEVFNPNKYYTSAQTQSYVQQAIEGGVDLSNYYTKAQIDAREWTGTKEEYDALSAKSDNITYFIISGTTA